MQYLKRLKFSLTCVCNENCPYCEYTDLNQKQIKFDINNFEKDIKVINKYFNYDEVSFSGGEPGLLNSNILNSLFNIFSNKQIEIYTNGLFFNHDKILLKHAKSIKTITYHLLSLDNLKRDNEKIFFLASKKIPFQFSYIVRNKKDMEELKLMRSKYKALFTLFNTIIHPALNRQSKKHSISKINEMLYNAHEHIAYHEEFLNNVCSLTNTLMYVAERRKFTVCCYSNIRGLMYSIDDIDKIDLTKGCPFENKCLVGDII